MLGQEKNYVLQLANVTEADLNMVGSVALQKSQIADLQIMQPEMFIVTSLAFDDFLTAGDLVEQILMQLARVIIGDWSSAVMVSQEIQQLIATATFPTLVLNPLIPAYHNLSKGRPAAIKLIPSWIMSEASKTPMSQFVIDKVVGDEHLLVALKQAWGSLFSPEAIFERAESRYTGPLSVSVVVQKIIQSEVSGTVVSIDPGNRDNLLVKAIYGIQDDNPLSEIPSDIYRVNKASKQITEKNILTQVQMLLLKQKSGNESHLMSVPISEAWQRKQKLEDRYIYELTQIMLDLVAKLEQELTIDYVLQGKDLYVVEVNPLPPELAQPKPELITVVDMPDELEDPAKKSKDPIDYSKLIADIDKLASQIQVVDNEHGLPTIDHTMDYPSLASGNLIAEDSALLAPVAEAIPQSPLNLPEMLIRFYLDVSDPKPEYLRFAGEFNSLQVDMLRYLQRAGLFLEDFAVDMNRSSDVIHQLSNEVGIAAKSSHKNSLLIKFSDFSKEDYHMLNKPIGPVGAARFTANPDVLALEYIAIKKAQRDYGLSKYELVLPPVRNYDQLIELKQILGQNGFRRSAGKSLGLNFSLPSTELILDDLTETDIDFAYISISEYAKMLFGENLQESDYRLMAKKLHQLAVELKGKRLELIIELGHNQSFLTEALQLNPSVIILKHLPTKGELDSIKKYAKSGEDFPLKVKRGRRPKQI